MTLVRARRATTLEDGPKRVVLAVGDLADLTEIPAEMLAVDPDLELIPPSEEKAARAKAAERERASEVGRVRLSVKLTREMLARGKIPKDAPVDEAERILLRYGHAPPPRDVLERELARTRPAEGRAASAATTDGRPARRAIRGPGGPAAD